MKEKMFLLTGIGVIAAVIVTLGFYAANASENTMTISEYIMVFIVLVIVAAAVWLMKDRLGSIRKGLPTKDERQTAITQKAGYYSWMVAIWSAIGTMWIGIFLEEEFGMPQLTANYVVAAVVLASGLAFFALFFYFNRKGG